MARKKNILVYLVDDDAIHNQMLEDHIRESLYAEVKCFSTGESCIAEMVRKPDIVVLDYNLDSIEKRAKNGLEILKTIKEHSPETEVVMLSGQDKLEIAVDTMRYGAYDYIVKNESAFVRSENVIFRINEKKALQKAVKRGNRLAYFMLAVFVAIVIFCVVVYFFFPELVPERAKYVKQ